MKIKKHIATLAITCLMAISNLSLMVAVAEEKPPFKGPYIGFGLSLDRFAGSYRVDTTNHDLKRYIRASTNLYAGYGFTQGPLYFGFEAGYTFNRSSEIDIRSLSKKTSSFFNVIKTIDTITVKNTIDLSARAGFATNWALFYGLAGYSNTKFENLTKGSKRLSALRYGAGMEVVFMKHGRIRFEYSTTNYGEWKYKLKGFKDPVFEPKSDRYKLSLTWVF